MKCKGMMLEVFIALAVVCCFMLALSSPKSVLAATGISLSGTYKIFTQEAGFWEYTGGEQPVVVGMGEGGKTSVVFDGEGGCTLTPLFAVRAEGWNPVQAFIFNEPPWSCTYSVNETGGVTISTAA